MFPDGQSKTVNLLLNGLQKEIFNASCHEGIDLDFQSVGEHTFRGTAIFKLNISYKAQLFWKNLMTNLVLFVALYLLCRLE